MENFLGLVLGLTLVVILFVIPMMIIFALATLALTVFSMMLKPITDPAQAIMETVSDAIPNPLDRIRLFPELKGYLGSTKNILFILFVILFLVYHFITHFQVLSNADNIAQSIFLLFPGSVLEQFMSSASDVTEDLFKIYTGKFDFSSLLVNPESYLQILIYPVVTGLFLHIGCTTNAPGAEIHIAAKLVYSLLITLFSAIVLGMIPSDMLNFSLPKISLDLTSAGSAAGDGGFLMMLAELREYFCLLLSKLVSIIPAIVAIYFLSLSISGIAAAFLAGMFTILPLALIFPNAVWDAGSPFAVFIVLLFLAVVEVAAMMLSESLNEWLEELASEIDLLKIYNIITLVIAYFFYPALPFSILCFIFLFVNGFKIAVLGIGLACLIVFSLVTFVGYILTNWVWDDEVGGAGYTVAMVFNVPIWIIYIIVFLL